MLATTHSPPSRACSSSSRPQHHPASQCGASRLSNTQHKHQQQHKCRAAPVVFEPHVDSQALTAQLLVLSVTVGTAAYWWLSVVPSARRTLAKEKRSGPLADYLLDLQGNPDKKPLQRWFYTDWLQSLSRRQQMAQAAAAKRAAAAAAAGAVAQQQQPQTGQPQPPAQQQQELSSSSLLPQQQEPSVEEDDDRMPSFWSLDNPILATAALLAGAAAVSSVLHP